MTSEKVDASVILLASAALPLPRFFMGTLISEEPDVEVALLARVLLRFKVAGLISEKVEARVELSDALLTATLPRFRVVGLISEKIEASVILLVSLDRGAGALPRFRVVGLISEKVDASVEPSFALLAAALPRFLVAGRISEKVEDEAALLTRVLRVCVVEITSENVAASVAVLARAFPLPFLCAGRTTSENVDGSIASLSLARVFPRFWAGRMTSEKVDASIASLERFLPRVLVVLATDDIDDVELRVDVRLAFAVPLPLFAGAGLAGGW